jgi:type IV fimbrial biogenesis protein FimT
MFLKQSHRRLSQGFTLVEVMVVLLVMGVLFALAIPSFRASSINGALKRTTGDLVTAINTARAQAVNLRVDIELKQRSSDWKNGWDLDYPATVTIESDKSFQQNGKVEVDLQGGATSLVFSSTGFVSSGAAVFELCIEGRGRKVEVSPLGRVTTTDWGC